jgi:hypothetical protein
MYRIKVTIIDQNGKACRDFEIGAHFEKTEDVISYIGKLDRTALKQFEIIQYDSDGQLIETVSYEDFLCAQRDIEFSKLLEQFDNAMTAFQEMTIKTFDNLERALSVAIKRMDESCKNAIDKIERSSSPPIEHSTGAEVVETDLRRSGALWLEQDETPMNPMDCVDVGAISDDK